MILTRYFVRSRKSEGDPEVVLEGPYNSEVKARDVALHCRNRGCVDVRIERVRKRPRGSGARK
jgi:hypothetical protein